MSDEQKDNVPTGFSGVSLLAPDIDSLVPSGNEGLSPEAYVLTRSLSPLDSSSKDSESDNGDQSDGDEAKIAASPYMGCTVLLIGGVTLAFLISISIQKESSRDFDYSRSTQMSTPPRPTQPAAKPESPPLATREVPIVNTPIETRKVEASQSQRPIGRPLEQKPPKSFQGPGALSIAQIRYCLAEEIRIEAARSVLDLYSAAAVARFNAMIDDYNDRCSNFLYWEGDLERARKDIEPFRKEIEEEGRARFRRSNSRSSEGLSAQ